MSSRLCEKTPHIRQAQVRYDINELVNETRGPGSISGTTEPDDLSPDCIYVAAYIHQQIVGCIRLNLGRRNRIKHLLPQQSILSPEVSKLVVCPLMNTDQTVHQALIVEVCKLALEHHHERLVALISLPMYDLFVQRGYPVKRLYDRPIFDGGRLNYPILWRPIQVMDLPQTPPLPSLIIKRLFPENRISLCR